MSGMRFSLDLFIKEPIPQALKDKLPEIRAAIKLLKSYASKINEGQVSEEMTIVARFHRCYHDENINKPCEPEVDI